MTRFLSSLICLLWLCIQHTLAFDLTHGQKVHIAMPASLESEIANTALTILGEDWKLNALRNCSRKLGIEEIRKLGK